MIRENDVERLFKREVERHGALVWKFISPNRAGVPDRIVLMRGGKAVFAEIKAPGKKPRPLQMAVIANLAHIDFETWVIDSPAEVEKFINHYIKIGYLT